MNGYLLFILLTSVATSAGAAPVSGTGRAIDGDSLMVGEQEVRLFGIDAPEFTQSCTRSGMAWACGSAAADQLTQLAGAKQVSCVSMGVDRYARVLGRCSAEGTDLNRTMVATGYALAYRRYSADYVSAEDSARLAKRGLWSGSFQRPSDARHDDHVIASPPERRGRRDRPVVSSVRSGRQATSGCVIKGNHSRRGEWIYHLPGMPYYAQTRAEAMFCSEAEARAAGYRRARVR